MVNATALETTIGNVITTYGANGTYYAPKATPTYTDEGDASVVFQATTVGIKMVEYNKLKSLEIQQIGNYELQQDTAIVRGSTAMALRGKIVSGTIAWEIVEIRPIEMKGSVIANEVRLRSLLP